MVVILRSRAIKIEDRKEQILESLDLLSKRWRSWKVDKDIRRLNAELEELEEIELNEKMLNYHMGEEYDPIDGHGKSCCY